MFIGYDPVFSLLMYGAVQKIFICLYKCAMLGFKKKDKNLKVKVNKNNHELCINYS